MAGHTAASLAKLVDGELVGNPQVTITGVSDLRTASGEHISFLGNDRYLQQARETGAGAVLVAKEAPSDFDFVQIRVESPNTAFIKIVELFAPEPPSYPPGVHSTAVVDPSVEIGQGACIQAHAVIEKGVRLGAGTVIGAGSFIGVESVMGEGCLLYPNVTVRERSVIGKRCIFHPGVVIGSDGFGFELVKGRHQKIPQVGYVQIDDDVEIGSNTSIDRGRFGPTWIEEGTKIDNLVQIAHNCRIGKHCIIVSGCGIAGSTTLGNYVTLAGHVGVAGHLHLGDACIVTANSGVSKDIPSQAVMSGRRAIPMRENLKQEALISRLPDLYNRVKKIEADQE